MNGRKKEKKKSFHGKKLKMVVKKKQNLKENWKMIRKTVQYVSLPLRSLFEAEGGIDQLLNWWFLVEFHPNISAGFAWGDLGMWFVADTPWIEECPRSNSPLDLDPVNLEATLMAPTNSVPFLQERQWCRERCEVAVHCVFSDYFSKFSESCYSLLILKYFILLDSKFIQLSNEILNIKIGWFVWRQFWKNKSVWFFLPTL